MIPHNRPTLDKEDIRAVSETIGSGWIAPGERAIEFEKRLSEFICGSAGPFAVSTDSGTSAIHLALTALGIKKGDEVIIPTYVCSAVLNAIMYTGATPVIADINPFDFNISYVDSVRKINDRTGAIIIPHMYGIPADLEQFMELDIPVIEDCAQSIGASYNGKPVGTWGDLSIFSFYATKLISTGKGGAVFSTKRDYINDILDLVDFDYRKEYKIRYNYRMNDIQASLGVSQLNKLHGFLKLRESIHTRYKQLISGLDRVGIMKIPANKEPVYYRSVLISDIDAPESIIQKFRNLGISVINPLENWELLHNYLGLPRDGYPNAEEATGKTISVPLYPSLREDEIQRVLKGIADIYEVKQLQPY